jgi:hypothetical protein
LRGTLVSMQGVTTAIVAFTFACLVYPHWVKSKPQYYAALGLVLVTILFDAIGHMQTDDGGLRHVMYVLAGLVQILNIIVLVMCVGGLSMNDLAGEVTNSFEVIRRGDDKPVLVPLTGEQPKVRDERPAVREERPAVREEQPAEAPRRPVRPKDDSSIPLD